MTAALLAAILADPDDLAARAVYGDWLCEQQDPRGELIALQLAGTTRKPALARIAKLIDEHGAAWSAALDAWFEPTGRQFEAGFFAGGALRFPRDPIDLSSVASEPAWRLVRVLENGWAREDVIAALAEHPQLCSLREVLWVSSTTAERLAAIRRPWTALAWWMDPPREPWPGLATLANLAALRTLGLVIHQVDMSRAWLASAPVLERIERLRLRSHDHVGYAIEAVARRVGALRTLSLELTDPLGHPIAWQIELSRESATEPFTRAIARHAGGAMDLVALCAPLAMLPTTLRELSVAAGRKLVVRAQHREMLAESLARFDQLERRALPWDDVAPKRHTARDRYQLHFEGTGLFERDTLTALWELLAGELRQPYDAFEVGRGTALHTIGEDPLARIAGWSERTDRLRLVHDGGPEAFELLRIGAFERVLVDVATDRSPNDMIAWLARFGAAARFHAGACAAGARPVYARFDLGRLRLGVLGGWATWFGAPFRDVVPPELAIEDCELHATPRGVLLRAAPTVRDATKQRLAAVAAEVGAAVIAAFPATLGFDFAADVADALAESFAALGFVHAGGERWDHVRFVRAGKLERHAELAIERVDDNQLPATLREVAVHATLSAKRRGDARGAATLRLAHARIAGRGELFAFLREVSDALATRGAAWIAAPLST